MPRLQRPRLDDPEAESDQAEAELLETLGWKPLYADLVGPYPVPNRVLELFLEMRAGRALRPADQPKKQGSIGGVPLNAIAEAIEEAR